MKKYGNLSLIVGLCLINISFLFWALPVGSIRFFAFLFFAILIQIILACILYTAIQKSWKIEKIFLCLGSIIGGFYVFAIPLSCAPDEGSHYFRIYELANGQLVSEVNDNGQIGSYQTISLTNTIGNLTQGSVKYSQIINNMSIYPDPDNVVFTHTTAYPYNVFSYAPHLVGMWTGRTLNLPIVITAYFARIFNLIACLAILYFSIKYIPFLKNILFFLSFSPANMQGMSTLSADGLIFATSIALISLVLYSIYTLKKIFTEKQLLLILVLCIFVSLTKFVYAPLCFLLFTIPKARFGNLKRKLIAIFSIGGITFAILLAWGLIMPSPSGIADSSSQISSLFKNPLGFFSMIIQTISTQASTYITGALGKYLEWHNVVLSPIYIIPSSVIFILLCFQAYQTFPIIQSFKIASAILFPSILLLLLTIMYIQWTDTEATVIEGVQGRYLLPTAPLISTAFQKVNPSTKIKITSEKPNYLLYIFLFSEGVYAILTIACTHV